MALTVAWNRSLMETFWTESLRHILCRNLGKDIDNGAFLALECMAAIYKEEYPSRTCLLTRRGILLDFYYATVCDSSKGCP